MSHYCKTLECKRDYQKINGVELKMVLESNFPFITMNYPPHGNKGQNKSLWKYNHGLYARLIMPVTCNTGHFSVIAGGKSGGEDTDWGWE